MNGLSWFPSQLNVTTIIAFAGFVISCIAAIHQITCERKNIRIKIFSYDADRDFMYLTMSFENLSRLPISITDIRYVNEREFSCIPIPVKICEEETRCGNEITERKITYSEKMPIQLEPLGAISGIILFEELPVSLKTDPKFLTFSICTNRGKAIQKTIELSSDVLSLRK